MSSRWRFALSPPWQVRAGRVLADRRCKASAIAMPGKILSNVLCLEEFGSGGLSGKRTPPSSKRTDRPINGYRAAREVTDAFVADTPHCPLGHARGFGARDWLPNAAILSPVGECAGRAGRGPCDPGLPRHWRPLRLLFERLERRRH